jgi:sensor histidine kinase regulating citrate/malate metabolism
MSGQFQQQGIGFSEITSMGGVGSLIFFSESELASIFEELFSNACEAMVESEKKEMVLAIVFSENDVTIRLSDTGCGLQTSDLDRVFTRDYSTGGQGRGYGLYHARQQVERFGGQIRIADNVGRPGATVELVLQTVKKAV